MAENVEAGDRMKINEAEGAVQFDLRMVAVGDEPGKDCRKYRD